MPLTRKNKDIIHRNQGVLCWPAGCLVCAEVEFCLRKWKSYFLYVKTKPMEKIIFCMSKSRMTASSPVWEWELVWSRDQWDLPCGTTSYRGRQYLGGARRRRQTPWQSQIRVMKTYFFTLGILYMPHIEGRFCRKRYAAMLRLWCAKQNAKHSYQCFDLKY